jgi:hypothetical protein
MYKVLKTGVDADDITEGLEHFDIAGSWRAHLESLGYEFPEEEWVNYDPLSTEFAEMDDAKAKEVRKKWEAAAASVMPDTDFNSAEFEYSDVRKYIIKGVWYFDRISTELKYRPIAIGPVAVSAEDKYRQTNDEAGSDEEDVSISNSVEAPGEADKEYTPMFWVFYPEARTVLSKAYAFNRKNMSKPFSFDRLINSRRFSGTIYKEANVYQDRNIRDYISNNALMQLLESERIKEKIRNKEQDMWSY